VSSDLKTQMTSLMNFSSCLLFFDKESLVFIMCSSSMVIVMVRGGMVRSKSSQWMNNMVIKFA